MQWPDCFQMSEKPPTLLIWLSHTGALQDKILVWMSKKPWLNLWFMQLEPATVMVSCSFICPADRAVNWTPVSWATPASRPRLRRRWPGFTGWGCPSTRNQSGCLEPWTSESPEPVRHRVRQWAHEKFPQFKFSQIACHSTDYLSTSAGGRPPIAVHFPLKYLMHQVFTRFTLHNVCRRVLIKAAVFFHQYSSYMPKCLADRLLSPAVRLFDRFSRHKRFTGKPGNCCPGKHMEAARCDEIIWPFFLFPVKRKLHPYSRCG